MAILQVYGRMKVRLPSGRRAQVVAADFSTMRVLVKESPTRTRWVAMADVDDATKLHGRALARCGSESPFAPTRDAAAPFQPGHHAEAFLGRRG